MRSRHQLDQVRGAPGALKQILLFGVFSLVLMGCSQGPKKSLELQPEQEIETKEISYTFGKTKMMGYLAQPLTPQKKPGILLVHEWWGQTDYARKRAEMLAKEGYVVFAVDMYGERQVAEHPEKAARLSAKTMKNMSETSGKFLSALSVLQSLPKVESHRLAALGYCYGGGLVLEMARQGAPLEMIFSFHGSLKGQSQAMQSKFRPEVFIFHGGSDPLIPKKQVIAFEKEMKRAKVKYHLYDYPEAKHAFTNPKATQIGEKFNLPLAYDQKADEDSWRKTLEALRSLF